MKKSELVNKAWYRVLQVIFGIAFAFCFFIVIVISVGEIPSSSPNYTELGKDVKLHFPAYEEFSDWEVGRRIYKKEMQSEVENKIRVQYPLYELPITIYGSWTKVMSNFLIGTISITIFFLIIRALSLYILLGKQSE